MGRRVKQGYPGRFGATVTGRPARGFDWTDGFHEILSFFVETPGFVLELCLARASFPGGDETTLQELATSLLEGVRWLAPDSASPTDAKLQPADAPRVWSVWRQDDHGNRFLVSARHSQAEAERICSDFEARGHKQMYWTERDVEEAG